MPILDQRLDDILCLQVERTVRPDNCVSYLGKVLQIPVDRHRCHYRKANVHVHEYADSCMAVFYGPRKLADYDETGRLVTETQTTEAAA